MGHACKGEVIHVCGADDGRPLWGCRGCGKTWTDGHPQASEDFQQRLVWLSQATKFRTIYLAQRVKDFFRGI